MLLDSSQQETDWFQKYKSIKRKFRDLYAVRILSVSNDIETLVSRLEEHKRVQKQTIEDIQSHTEEMKQEIELTRKMREDISEKETNVRNLRRQLKSRDPIVGLLIDYPKLRCHVVSKDQYRVRASNGLEFGLIKGDSIRYIPIKVPGRIRGMDNLRKEFTMRISDLAEFCRRIADT